MYIYICKYLFGKVTFLENNLYEWDAVSHQKEGILARTEASLFCETGINCWAQTFATQKLATLPWQKITTTMQAEEEMVRHFVIVTKWTASDFQTFLILLSDVM